MIKHLTILIAIVLTITNSYSQNLILNGSFEDIDTNELGFQRIKFWIQPQYASPDLYEPTSAPSSLSSNDTNTFGFQLPQQGLNYVGGRYFVTGPTIQTNFGREPIIGKTKETLLTNTQYCFSFYISLADKDNCSVKQINTYFSNSPYDPIINGSPHLIYTEPQWEADTTNFYTDKLIWVRVEGIYTASGVENFLTIGNLHWDVDTDTLCSGIIEGYPTIKEAYYYMDNFSLEEIKPIVTGNDKNITIGNSTIIGDNSDSASSYTWSPNYFIDDTNAVNPIVNPPQTTTYYVTKTQCNVTTSDSITVFVHPVGVSEYYNNTSFNLYPNPNKGIFNFKYTIQQDSKLSIYNFMGQEVESIKLPSNKKLITVDMSTYSSGVYTYKVMDKSKLISISKFIIR